jgi:hypothetical protein
MRQITPAVVGAPDSEVAALCGRVAEEIDGQGVVGRVRHENCPARDAAMRQAGKREARRWRDIDGVGEPASRRARVPVPGASGPLCVGAARFVLSRRCQGDAELAHAGVRCRPHDDLETVFIMPRRSGPPSGRRSGSSRPNPDEGGDRAGRSSSPGASRSCPDRWCQRQRPGGRPGRAARSRSTAISARLDDSVHAPRPPLRISPARAMAGHAGPRSRPSATA